MALSTTYYNANLKRCRVNTLNDKYDFDEKGTIYQRRQILLGLCK